MVDLGRYQKHWRDDRFNWRKDGPPSHTAHKKSRLVDHLLTNSIWWIYYHGGSLNDLIFDVTKGGIGKFSEDGHKVVVRHW